MAKPESRAVVCASVEPSGLFRDIAVCDSVVDKKSGQRHGSKRIEPQRVRVLPSGRWRRDVGDGNGACVRVCTEREFECQIWDGDSPQSARGYSVVSVG